ncbi:MAG TPA: copper resistance system multicopper oxidase [Steroidobacteraceae bacterium]|nr:copper resistance system multicopper oxidase [Steroidobacteraceae bacterium]
MNRKFNSAAQISRRSFLAASSAGLFVLGHPRLSLGETNTRQVLTGPQFDLTIDSLGVNFTGRARRATVVNDQLPGPLLRMRQGDVATIRVTNRLPATSSIHWHGMIVPADMDGVPGLSFHGIPSGGTYTYRFAVNQSGTYWYHAHSGFQEQTGLMGPIIVERRGGERHRTERDYVVMLSDWTDLDPGKIFGKLKKQSDYFNYGQRTAGDFLRDIDTQGFRSTLADRLMWGGMRMNPTDLADVSAAAYTYLMNGVTPASNWTGMFSRGERVRLRFINAGAMSIFDVRIPGLKMTVVAADGQDVEPVTVDEFRISAAETYDVIVEPNDDRAYTIFAQSLDRSGYARGTLAPSIGMQADIPPLDPRPLLSMMDMGMAHDMSGNPASMDHSQMDHSRMDHSRMDHSGMDHSPMDQRHMDHNGHAQVVTPKHPATERGTTVDMQADQVRTSIDDPGVGLRDNGRRVLTYADLHTLGGPIDHREPSREIELHLTGHMERYIWSFNGQKFSDAEPLRFNYGERLRVALVNDTMMMHPIHLHGMWSELESPQGEFQVRKHTVNVNPAQRITYQVTADALGRWAYHCHLAMHMEAGMFREVRVARDGEQT